MHGCPLCGATAAPWTEVDSRVYHACADCALVFLDPSQRLDAAAEAAHYALHENRVDDPAYRRFLARLASPLLEVLPAGSRGLDYGCGPGPAMAAMLTEAGHTVALYDPLFAPGPGVLEACYDFITCTETVEHFHRPGFEFPRLAGMLAAGGVLAVMTAFRPEQSAFAQWHYRRDPTHVAFYGVATFEWIAAHHGWTAHFPAPDVVFLKRQ